MSSERRPWYPWYPKDFNVDEKVKALSDDAELLYRRVLDILWQANALQLPSKCSLLRNQIARGWQKERFEDAWNQLVLPEFELLKTTEDGEWVYSCRLRREAEKIENISKIRSESAKKSNEVQKHRKSTAKAPQKHRHTDTDIEIYSRVISYLNQKTGKNFKPNNKTTKAHINARLSEGFTEQDFITVIDKKCSKWLSDPKMSDFLRPQTLFGTKFESYLNDGAKPATVREYVD